MKLSPIEYVIWAFGGARSVAGLLGLSTQTVYSMKNRGDTVPVHWQKRLLDAAREMNIDLTSDDVIYGRKLDKSTYENGTP